MSNKKTILTIDDDVDFNNLLKQELQKLPVDLITTTTVDEFLKGLTTVKPDICLVDLNVGDDPEMGFKIVAAIRKKFENKTKLLVVSAEHSSERVTLALEMGASDYITKPLDVRALQKKLNYFLYIPEERQFFRRVPAALSPVILKMKFQITSIDEFGLEIISNIYIARGTSLKISSPVFEQMGIPGTCSCVVTRTSSSGKDAFSIILEYEEKGMEFSTKIREWVSAQQ